MKSLQHATWLSILFVSQAFSQIAPATSPYLKQPEVSETEGTVHILANNPRPLAQALDALREKYGWSVSYEDPRWLFKSDWKEAAGTPADSNAPLFPAGGRFAAEFPASLAASAPPASAQTSSAEEEKAVRLIVEAYNRGDNPGRFELRKSTPGNLSVVGVAAHDAKGQVSPQKAIFDSLLTLPRSQRSATETIQLLCEKLSSISGTNVSLGVTPRNLLDHNQVTVGGAEVAARDLLLEILTLTHGNCYWRLLFDPNSKGYLLNLHQLRALKAPAKESPKDPGKGPSGDPSKNPAKPPA
jgi:hypothetical protein